MNKQIPDFNKVDIKSFVEVRNELCHNIAFNDGCEYIACHECILNSVEDLKEFLNGD